MLVVLFTLALLQLHLLKAEATQGEDESQRQFILRMGSHGELC